MAVIMDGIYVNGQKATFRPEDILSGDASAYTEEIGTAVEEWMEENVTGGEQVTDTTLTLPGVPADAKKVGDEISDLKEDLNANLLDYIDIVNPTNWYNPNDFGVGELNANGTSNEVSTSWHTNYFIPVTFGDVIRFRRMDNKTGLYMRHITAYDSDKNLLPTKGTDGATFSYTIKEGTAYVKVTGDSSIIPLNIMKMLSVDQGTPTTVYSAYFDPYKTLTKDFLTGISETAMTKLVDGLSTADLKNKYACALSCSSFKGTVGIPEKWYYKTAVTPPSSFINIAIGAEKCTRCNDYVNFPNDAEFSSVNGYAWYWHDTLLNLIESFTGSAGYGGYRKIIAENLSDCSLLAIGDSTVDHDVMTATLLTHFTEQGHTITLLGTLGDGSGTNNNEGRAGWKASDYFTNRQYKGVVNPFYNPTTETFDFAYYMTNQGYSDVDFVVLQLGINDLYLTGAAAIPATWGYIKGMIDSILAFNNSIKILLNLPTTPNSDLSKHSLAFEPTYRNCVIRYNSFVLKQVSKEYSGNNVRCSYCHLILDPDTDIRDNVHPTVAGYQKMALEVVNQINCWQNGV